MSQPVRGLLDEDRDRLAGWFREAIDQTSSLTLTVNAEPNGLRETELRMVTYADPRIGQGPAMLEVALTRAATAAVHAGQGATVDFVRRLGKILADAGLPLDELSSWGSE